MGKIFVFFFCLFTVNMGINSNIHQWNVGFLQYDQNALSTYKNRDEVDRIWELKQKFRIV